MLGAMWGRVVNAAIRRFSTIPRRIRSFFAGMLLTGTFKRSIDDKLRIAIPKRFRDSLSAKNDDQAVVLYLAPGTDGSLTVYTEESFARLADQLGQASPTEKDVRAFSRLFFSRAEGVDLDRQGRIRIPAELAGLAELTQGEAMMIGVRDRMEIWNSDKWRQYMEANESDYDALAEKAFDRS